MSRLLMLTAKVGNHHNYHLRPQVEREYVARVATALPAEKFPKWADGWPGFLRIGNRLAIHDNPEARRKAARCGFDVVEQVPVPTPTRPRRPQPQPDNPRPFWKTIWQAERRPGYAKNTIYSWQVREAVPDA